MKNGDKQEKVQIAVMANDITYIKDKVSELSAEFRTRLAIVENGYVKRDELNRVATELDSVRRSTSTQWYSIAIISGGVAVIAFLIGKGLIKGL